MSFWNDEDRTLLETVPPLRSLKKSSGPTLVVEEVKEPEPLLEAVKTEESVETVESEASVETVDASAAEAAVDAALAAVVEPTVIVCEKCEVMHQFMLELLEAKDTPLVNCVDRLVAEWDEARQEVARLAREAQVMTKELNKKDAVLLEMEAVVKDRDAEYDVLERRYREALQRLVLFERLVDQVSQSYGLERDIQAHWRNLKAMY
jgi:hypothetical protein